MIVKRLKKIKETQKEKSEGRCLAIMDELEKKHGEFPTGALIMANEDKLTKSKQVRWYASQEYREGKEVTPDDLRRTLAGKFGVDVSFWKRRIENRFEELEIKRIAFFPLDPFLAGEIRVNEQRFERLAWDEGVSILITHERSDSEKRGRPNTVYFNPNMINEYGVVLEIADKDKIDFGESNKEKLIKTIKKARENK